jgi:hypothetical protein
VCWQPWPRAPVGHKAETPATIGKKAIVVFEVGSGQHAVLAGASSELVEALRHFGEHFSRGPHIGRSCLVQGTSHRPLHRS